MQKNIRFAAVAIAFNKKGQILMVQRHKPGQRTHGLWAFPGGGIEFGENPSQAAIRETKEETNIDIKLITKHPFVYSHVWDDKNSQSIVLGFPAKALNEHADASADQHTSDARWFDIDKIDFSTCIPLMREFISDAKKVFK